jgi:predicted aspartyl protease
VRRAPLLLLTVLCSACDADARGRAATVADTATHAAAADTTGDGVAIRLAGDNDAAVLVPVHVNGAGPFDFVLDTGATLTCVDASLANRLALEAEPGRLGFGLDASRPGQVQLLRIDSLRVGNAATVDLDACVLDLAHIQAAGLHVDGLLGLNFLKQFRVTLDFEKEEILLRKF